MTKPTYASLEDLLTTVARKDTGLFGSFDTDDKLVRYTTHENAAALSNKWLDEGTSYIWRVGVLMWIDGNKADWFHVWIGTERTPYQYDYIGHLHFRDGENDDPGRVLARALWLMGMQHPSFDIDR